MAVGTGDEAIVQSNKMLPDETLALLASGLEASDLHMAATDDHLLIAQRNRAHWLDASGLEPVGEPIELTGHVAGLTSGDRPLIWFGSGRPPLALTPPQ